MKTKTLRKLLPVLIFMTGIFSANSLLACNATFTYTLGLNGHVTFFDSAAAADSGYLEYIWNPGDGNGTMYGSNPYHYTYTANGTYYAVLTVEDSLGGCSATDSIVVTINNVTAPCTLKAAYTYTVNPHGQVSFTSTSTGTNANTLYYWTPGDGSPQTQGTNAFSYTYANQGYYNVWLTIIDTGAAYCIDSTLKQVLVQTADSNACGLHANFTYTIGANGHVTFTGTSTDSLYSIYSWYPGDGGPKIIKDSSSDTYSHIYTANGTYTVSLVITEYAPSYCSDSVAIPVTISNVTIPCELSASFTATNDTATGEVTFVSTSTGTNTGTQYYWIPGDGSPQVLGTNTFNYTYPANGTYIAQLIIKDTGSAFCVDSNTLAVNVSNVDSLHASFTDSLLYDTGSYYYWYHSTSTGVNSATVYAWEPGDSTAGDTAVNLVDYYHVYRYPGLHTATLSIWFSNYPIIGHNTGRIEGSMYDFSTYSKLIDVGVPQSIADITSGDSGLKLYPNPNNGKFRLVINGMHGNTDAKVQVTNLLGEVVYTTVVPVKAGMINSLLNLQSVTNGAYFVRIITGNKVYNTRTIINR